MTRQQREDDAVRDEHDELVECDRCGGTGQTNGPNYAVYRCASCAGTGQMCAPSDEAA